jgi:hypothetical protein
MIGESEGGTSVDFMLKSSVCVMSVRSVPTRLRVERCKVEPWSRSPNAHSVFPFLAVTRRSSALSLAWSTRPRLRVQYEVADTVTSRLPHIKHSRAQDCHSLENDAVCRNMDVSSCVCKLCALCSWFSISLFGHCLMTCGESQVTSFACLSFDLVPFSPACAPSELRFRPLHDDQHPDLGVLHPLSHC